MKLHTAKFVSGLCLMVVLGAAVLAQESDASRVEVAIAEIYLAKDDGNGNAGEEATGFVTTDIPIHCVVQLDSAVPVTVTMNLVAVAVPGVKRETRVVSASYKTIDNQNRVNFSGRPAGQWVAGRYRVDIFVGKAPVVSREFAVQKAVQSKPTPRSPTKPAEKSRLAVKKS